MKASQILIEKIKEFEGLRLKAYKDSVGVLTIGYGHTKNVKSGMTITQQTAKMFLKQDLEPLERSITELGICTTQGQFDAIIDFCFNLGLTKFKGSTLYKYIKAKKAETMIQRQFRAWVYAGGKVLPGLVKRRDWEAKRWTE